MYHKCTLHDSIYSLSYIWFSIWYDSPQNFLFPSISSTPSPSKFSQILNYSEARRCNYLGKWYRGQSAIIALMETVIRLVDQVPELLPTPDISKDPVNDVLRDKRRSSRGWDLHDGTWFMRTTLDVWRDRRKRSRANIYKEKEGKWSTCFFYGRVHTGTIPRQLI